jgi:hypothetical protein
MDVRAFEFLSFLDDYEQEKYPMKRKQRLHRVSKWRDKIRRSHLYNSGE